MQLILMRHGEAGAPVTSDAARQLTPLGEWQAASTARQIMQVVQPDLFVVSPLVRAQQTRAAFDALAAQVPVITCDAIKPDDDAQQAINWLSRQVAQCIVVVCHMNIVAHMDSILTGGAYGQFALAEARLYQQEVIGGGLSSKTATWLPLAP